MIGLFKKEEIVDFLKAAGIRAVKTFFQTLGSTIGVSAVFLHDVEWLMALSASALAAILSICTSIATGLPEAPIGKNVKE